MEVRSTVVENGYRLEIGRAKTGRLRKSATFEPAQDWASGLKALGPLPNAVIEELEQGNKLGSSSESSKLLSFQDAATLQNYDAEALNLPPAFPFQLDIQSRGTLGTNNFQISYSVTQGGVRVLGTLFRGYFIAGEQQYRISDPLFSILDRIDAVNTASDAAAKIEHFAALRLLLPEDISNSNVVPERFMLRIRISHVTAIGLRPSIDQGNVSFDPIPLRRVNPHDYQAGADLALTPAAVDTFAQQFRTQRNVNSTYALESGQYVYIDPAIRIALRVVKQKQSAPLEERMAFLLSPMKAITDAYQGEDAPGREVPIGDTIFFETSEYSERIIGIGEWIPPQLSYLEAGENNWLPERFSIVLSGRLITGSPDDVPKWIDQVKGAIASKKEEVVLGGISVPANAPGLLATLMRLQPPEVPPHPEKDEYGATSLRTLEGHVSEFYRPKVILISLNLRGN